MINQRKMLLLVAVIGLVFYLGIRFGSGDSEPTVKIEAVVDNTEVKRWRDAYNRERLIVAQQTVDVTAFKFSTDSVIASLRAEAKALGLKLKHVKKWLS